MKRIDIFLEEVFYILVGALLIFCGLEIILPGLVLAYININYVLIFWLIVSIIILVKDPKENVSK